MRKICLFMCLCMLSCTGEATVTEMPSEPEISLSGVAKMLSELPLGGEQLEEVYNAASASSANGYDEEYMMRDIFEAPGCGVGADSKTRAAAMSSYDHSLGKMIREYYAVRSSTKAGLPDADEIVKALSGSGYQLYIPFSENWDGKTFPIITFDPGFGAESNYGYELKASADGKLTVDSVLVTENVARERPVWVVNNNDDSGFVPLEAFYSAYTGDAGKGGSWGKAGSVGTNGGGRMLMLKSFKMLRNYDSWFAGGSEFFVKCGSVEGFKAKTEEEMRNYYPSVTDFMVVVRRAYKGKDMPIGTIMMTDFTDQLETLAFLVTEDDGGTTTSWKCSATVKVASKSYGLDLEIPYKDKDDIVWRGQLSADFLRSEDEVSGRFGDVVLTFALE